MNEEKRNYEGEVEKSAGKLPYEKPTLNIISLFANEVLSGCSKSSPAPGGDCDGDPLKPGGQYS